MSSRKTTRQFTFQPGAYSILQMGEELIGHPSTALNELVKNAFDADAKNCSVYFHLEKTKELSFAVIWDNGTGMSGKTLFGNWLRPSISSKRVPNGQSLIFKRHFLGSKGIGRLAAMAIGTNVTVISKTQNEVEFNWISISRENFRSDVLLKDVKFPGGEVADPSGVFHQKGILRARKAKQNGLISHLLGQDCLTIKSNGTLIVIEGLDDSVWGQLSQDFKEKTDGAQEFDLRDVQFHKSISTLITPLSLDEQIKQDLFQAKILLEAPKDQNSENTFEVKFGVNKLLQDDNGVPKLEIVEPIPIHKIFDYRIYGMVNEMGKVSAKYVFDRLDEVNRQIFNVEFDLPNHLKKPKNLAKAKEKQAPTLFPPDTDLGNRKRSCGPFSFDIRVYDIGEPDNLKKLATKSGFSTPSAFRTAFKSFQGLRVSKNGFGVKPYGEEVEDWIDLSKARVQNPGQNVNTNQILGYVFFQSPENDLLQEKTNREGFLENVAFREVKTALQAIFKDLGNKRYHFRLQHNLGRSVQGVGGRPNFEEYLETVRNTNNLKEVREYSEKFMKEVSTSMDNLETSLSFAERLATLGNGIELIFHEMAQPISGLKTTESSLKLKRTKIDDSIRDSFEKDISSISHGADTLKNLRDSLRPAIGRGRKRLFHPYDTFEKVCNLYQSDLQKYAITVEISTMVKALEIEGYEYPFWITFLNLMNNAVYWVSQLDNNRLIRLYSEGESILFENSGPPIQESILDWIFEYGVTTRREETATGLGLSFARNALSRNGWSISAANSKTGPIFSIKPSK